MIKKAGNLFATAYLLLMFGIYPFYMKEGYVDIGEGKYEFFIHCSLGALVILAVLAVLRSVQVMRQRRLAGEAYLIDWSSVSVTDVFVLLFVAEITVSGLFSDFKEEVIWGTEGWHIGLIPLITLCCLYLILSRMWDGSKNVLYISMLVSGVVFLLGILDSFSLYLIPLEIRESGFISTMGNINWFCGYLSVLAPIGICMFLFSEKEKEIKRLFYGSYAVIAFMAGFSQGSNSIFLWFGGLFFVLLWICVESKKKLADWFLLVFLWGISAQLVRLMKYLIPNGYNYEQDNLCGYFTGNSLTLWIAILAFVVYAGLVWSMARKMPVENLSEDTVAKIRIGLLAFLAAGIVSWVILSIMNTWTDVAGFISSNLFVWNKTWGHGRGAALQAAFQMFEEMPFLKKLFGVGPDCFAAYAYSLPEVAAGLRDYFGSSRLTNAHNELVTCLVNTGILGTLFYVGIFVSYIVRSFKAVGKDPFVKIAGICVCCYLVHNMVSFAQVLNLPFLILVMAMGESLTCIKWLCDEKDR